MRYERGQTYSFPSSFNYFVSFPLSFLFFPCFSLFFLFFPVLSFSFLFFPFLSFSFLSFPFFVVFSFFPPFFHCLSVFLTSFWTLTFKVSAKFPCSFPRADWCDFNKCVYEQLITIIVLAIIKIINEIFRHQKNDRT